MYFVVYLNKTYVNVNKYFQILTNYLQVKLYIHLLIIFWPSKDNVYVPKNLITLKYKWVVGKIKFVLVIELALILGLEFESLNLKSFCFLNSKTTGIWKKKGWKYKNSFNNLKML